MSTMIETANVAARNLAAASGLSDADWQQLQANARVTLEWDGVLRESFGDAIRAGSSPPASPETEVNDTREQAFGVWVGSVLAGVPGETFWPETYLMGLDYASAGFGGPLLITMENRVEEAFFQKAKQALEPVAAMELYLAFKKVFSTAVSVMAESSVHVASVGMKKVGVNERLFDNIINSAIKSEIEEARASLPLIEWNASLSVGVESIDTQHRKLVDLLNALHSSSVGGKNDETLRGILDELVSYTKTHFAYEENLMTENGYPDTAAHFAAHVALTNQVVQFSEEFQSGKSKLTADLFNFLRNWLNGHIRGTDKKYSALFREKGVQ